MAKVGKLGMIAAELEITVTKIAAHPPSQTAALGPHPNTNSK
jgi:hypothetical protein